MRVNNLCGLLRQLFIMTYSDRAIAKVIATLFWHNWHWNRFSKSENDIVTYLAKYIYLFCHFRLVRTDHNSLYSRLLISVKFMPLFHLQVWDLDMFEMKKQIVAHDNPVCTLVCARGQLFSGSLKVIKASTFFQ